MADSSVSLALQRIKEQIAALNFASDAITLLLDKGELDPTLAELRLRRLSARRTDLRDERMAIMETKQVTRVPTTTEVKTLRKRVAALYDWNKASDSIDGLILEALAIAAS